MGLNEGGATLHLSVMEELKELRIKPHNPSLKNLGTKKDYFQKEKALGSHGFSQDWLQGGQNK